ncbi:UNVERIFIED_CONTAM: hypothetical protein Sradi_3143800 [Sesamum radiatum]|uniref:Uncharacterized protein n=1 Tax=Sesamum radiatum TaxID=300843 RepID=A0AAW2REX6_SESRA
MKVHILWTRAFLERIIGAVCGNTELKDVRFMEATNNRDSISSGRMVPLTSEDVRLMLTTSDVPLEKWERVSPSKNKLCSQAGTLLKKSCPSGHPHQKDVPSKSKRLGRSVAIKLCKLLPGRPLLRLDEGPPYLPLGP